jgi:hypothetical protein
MSNTNCEENIKKLISEYNINGRVLLKFLNYTLYALFIMYVLSDFWHMYDKNNNKNGNSILFLEEISNKLTQIKI